MIIGDTRIASGFHEEGLWGKAGLDQLLRRLATAMPARPLLTDAENRCGWQRDFRRTLTAGALDRMVSALSARLLDLGIRQDEVVAIHLPNTTEGVVATLAVLRAGAIAAPLPFAWRRAEMTAAFARINPAALITVSAFSGVPLAGIACETALETFSIRHVLAFGDALPDGVAPLDDALADDADTEGDMGAPRTGTAADHLACVVFRSGNPEAPVCFTHNQLVTAMAVFAASARLGEGAVVLNTLPLSALAGIAAGLVPMLATGARLVLSVPFDIAVLRQDISAQKLTHIVLPAAVAASGRVVAAVSQSFDGRLVRYWSDPVAAAAARVASGLRGTDIVSLDDLALVTSEDPAGNGWFHAGKVRIGDGITGPVVMQARLHGGQVKAGARHGSLLRGELEIAGPMCPDATFTAEGKLAALADKGFIRTGLRAGFVDASGSTLACTGRMREIFRVGGLTFDAAAIDALFRAYPGAADAVAYVEPNALFGDTLHAAIVPAGDRTFSAKAFRDYLREAGIAEFRMPERIAIVEEIPRGGDGAVLRRQMTKAA